MCGTLLKALLKSKNNASTSPLLLSIVANDAPILASV